MIVKFGLIGVLAGCSTGSQPYEIDGHWVGSVVRPARDLEYLDIEPGGSGDLIVLGSRLVLRVGDNPHVILGIARPGGTLVGRPAGYASTSSGEFYAFSFGRTEHFGRRDVVDNAIFARTGDDWSAVPLPIEATEDEPWSFGRLISFEDELYAIVNRSNPLTRVPAQVPFDKPPWRSRLYRWDRRAWTNVSPPSSEQVNIGSACALSTRELLVAGRRYLEPIEDGAPGVVGYLASYSPESHQWREEASPLPANAIRRWAFSDLACDADGRAWASADYGSTDTGRTTFAFQGRSALYVRESGRWRMVEDLPVVLDDPSPERTSYVTITALAVDKNDGVWLAEHGDPQRIPRFWRYDGRSWKSFEVPAPEGYKPLYPVVDLFFDQAGDGWAIANIFGGVADPRHRPVLMHYRDGKWQLRGWSWRFWQQRWFGLSHLTGEGFD